MEEYRKINDTSAQGGGKTRIIGFRVPDADREVPEIVVVYGARRRQACNLLQFLLYSAGLKLSRQDNQACCAATAARQEQTR
jgi:hypothetical protein